MPDNKPFSYHKPGYKGSNGLNKGFNTVLCLLPSFKSRKKGSHITLKCMAHLVGHHHHSHLDHLQDILQHILSSGIFDFFFLFFSNEQVTGTIMYFKTHMIIFKQLLYSNCKAIYMHFFESVKVSMAGFSNLTTRHDSTTSQTPIYNSVTYWFRVWSW